MRILKVILFSVFAISLFGCTPSQIREKFTMQPILEPTYQVTGLTSAQVKTAILNAAKTDRGWVLKSAGNNTIKGSLINREHSVEVTIPYSANGYTIKYVSSSASLGAHDGKIHRVYNRWVTNLDTDIKANLIRM